MQLPDDVIEYSISDYLSPGELYRITQNTPRSRVAHPSFSQAYHRRIENLLDAHPEVVLGLGLANHDYRLLDMFFSRYPENTSVEPMITVVVRGGDWLSYVIASAAASAIANRDAETLQNLYRGSEWFTGEPYTNRSIHKLSNNIVSTIDYFSRIGDPDMVAFLLSPEITSWYKRHQRKITEYLRPEVMPILIQRLPSFQKRIRRAILLAYLGPDATIITRHLIDPIKRAKLKEVIESFDHP